MSQLLELAMVLYFCCFVFAFVWLVLALVFRSFWLSVFEEAVYVLYFGLSFIISIILMSSLSNRL